MATTVTRKPKARKPARSNISPRLACLNLPSDRAGSDCERPAPRQETAAAYRALAARLGGDADATLHSTAMTPEREHALELAGERLARIPTDILMALLPVLGEGAAYEGDPGQGMKVVTAPGTSRA